MSQVWIVIKTRNNALDLALAWTYEFDDYRRVSRRFWDYEDKDEAIVYGRELAKKNGLEVEGDLYRNEDEFLD